jgi:hypothetical protein
MIISTSDVLCRSAISWREYAIVGRYLSEWADACSSYF